MSSDDSSSSSLNGFVLLNPFTSKQPSSTTQAISQPAPTQSISKPPPPAIPSKPATNDAPSVPSTRPAFGRSNSYSSQKSILDESDDEGEGL